MSVGLLKVLHVSCGCLDRDGIALCSSASLVFARASAATLTIHICRRSLIYYHNMSLCSTRSLRSCSQLKEVPKGDSLPRLGAERRVASRFYPVLISGAVRVHIMSMQHPLEWIKRERKTSAGL